jgi:hypothetical protein
MNLAQHIRDEFGLCRPRGVGALNHARLLACAPYLTTLDDQAGFAGIDAATPLQ